MAPWVVHGAELMVGGARLCFDSTHARMHHPGCHGRQEKLVDLNYPQAINERPATIPGMPKQTDATTRSPRRLSLLAMARRSGLALQQNPTGGSRTVRLPVDARSTVFGPFTTASHSSSVQTAALEAARLVSTAAAAPFQRPRFATRPPSGRFARGPWSCQLTSGFDHSTGT
jgi:hypothetical protein